MHFLEFTESSAISKVAFDHDNGEIGVAFTADPEKWYFFECDDTDGFVNLLEDTVNSNKSLGRFISDCRRDGTLFSVQSSGTVAYWLMLTAYNGVNWVQFPAVSLRTFGL